MNMQQTVEVGKVVTILFNGPSSKPLNISISNNGYQDLGGVVCISPQTPLAAAILNRAIGEDVEFDSPEGKLKVKIVKVV